MLKISQSKALVPTPTFSPNKLTTTSLNSTLHSPQLGNLCQQINSQPHYIAHGPVQTPPSSQDQQATPPARTQPKNPKPLSLTFDTMFTFTPHHRTTAAKASQRNNILKALSGTSFGQTRKLYCKHTKPSVAL
jgi:hypothetical protein